MAEIECREAGPDDVTGLLAVKNSIFPPVSLADWEREKNKTAVVALDGGQVVGAIPLALRPLRIAPGVVIRSAFENSVGVIEGRRGQGIGTAMIECAARFLKGRVDALMVYRGDERSPPYRFYRKTGHVPLHRARRLVRPATGSGEAPSAELAGASVIRACQEELLSVFREAWSAWSGFPERDGSYWDRALDSYIFAELKHVPKLLRLARDGRTTAYAILGVKPDLIRIDEMAAASAEAARALLAEAVAHAEAGGCGIAVYSAGPGSPYRDLFGELGFVEQPRSLAIMGLPLEVEGLARMAFRRTGMAEGVGVRIWTPLREFALREANSSGRAITLEMDEETLVRLGLCRLDMRGAVREERVTVRNGTSSDVKVLDATPPPAPWIYHSLDDI